MDIAQSLHRVLNEEYILYHMHHYNLMIPKRTDEYLSPVQSRMNQSAVRDVLGSQVQAIVKSIESRSGKATSALEIMEALEHGKLLEDILDNVVDTLNTSIQKSFQNNFSDIIQQAHGFNKLFEKGKASGPKVESFFNLVIQGIQMMTGGQVPKWVFTELSQMGKTASKNTRFSYSDKKYDTATPVTRQQLDVINKIMEYLSTAVDKLKTEGKVSSQSLQATITNIFSFTLGEQIGQQMIEAAMPDLDSQMLELNDKILGKKNKNIKLVSTNFEKNPEGQSKKFGKANIINNEALQLSLTINGSLITIDIATNASVKWYKGDAKGHAKISLGKMSLGDLLNDFGITPRGIAYNIIAHNDPIGMQKLRSTIAASYINAWIDGAGGLDDSANKTQMLLVNGKLYTMSGIIRKLIRETPYGNASASPLKLSFSKLNADANAWEMPKQGESMYSWSAAERRSRRAQSIINGLQISAEFNSKFLGLT